MALSVLNQLSCLWGDLNLTPELHGLLFREDSRTQFLPGLVFSASYFCINSKKPSVSLLASITLFLHANCRSQHPENNRRERGLCLLEDFACVSQLMAGRIQNAASVTGSSPRLSLAVACSCAAALCRVVHELCTETCTFLCLRTRINQRQGCSCTREHHFGLSS